MSILSPRWHGRFARPAPARAGRLSTSMEGPPDGWPIARGHATDRVAERLDRAVLSAADTAALAISRRDLLKRAGQLGLVVSLGVSGILWRARTAAGYAYIYNSCDPLGDPPTGPCGPNGLCESSLCSGGNCANSQSKRTYGGSGCCSGCTGTVNCWQENCCANNNWNSHMKCCDCCTSSGTGGSCTRCTGASAHKCICRSKVGMAC